MRACATARPEAGQDATLDENAWLHRGLLRLPDLDQDKGDQEHKGKHKQCDDSSLTPLRLISSAGPKIGGKAPLRPI